MSDLEDSLDAVCDKQTFLNFLNALVFDCKLNKARWENNTLDSYLEGMHGWLEDMDLNVFYERINLKKVMQSEINWRVFADVLIAATIYE
ncbi:MAG: hypothetical protein JF606_03005 [Burkholderiales bacterium]|jgi:hypothetical protein|nr:hypothetical protein [Burkholderiales bacterium]